MIIPDAPFVLLTSHLRHGSGRSRKRTRGSGSTTDRALDKASTMAQAMLAQAQRGR